MDNDGVCQTNNVIKYIPSQPVLNLEVGERVELTEEQSDRLSGAFFAELEAKFL